MNRYNLLVLSTALLAPLAGTAAVNDRLPTAGAMPPPLFDTTGEWGYGTLAGHTSSASTLYTRDPAATATWRPNLQSACPVRIGFYLIIHPGNTPSARVEVTGGAEPLMAAVDLSSGTSRWETVGIARFQGRGEELITVRNSAKGALRLSAVRLDILDLNDTNIVWQTLILDETVPTKQRQALTPALVFTDVHDPAIQAAASALATAGLFRGRTATTFAPDEPMSGNEFLAVLRAMHGKELAGSDNTLSIPEAYALLLAAARQSGKSLAWIDPAAEKIDTRVFAAALGLAEAAPAPGTELRRGQAAILLRCYQQAILHSGPPPGNWKLSFQDEFNTGKLDTNVWGTAHGESSPKRLYSRWPENTIVEQGMLRLVTHKENRGSKEWTSGSVGTKIFKQKYGYWEARFRYAAATGLNNAFWTAYPRQKNVEYDGFEIDFNEGHYPNVVNMTLHQANLPPKSKAWHAPCDLSREFHTYGVLWGEHDIIYYWDGQEIDRKPHTKAHLETPVIFSTAVIPWGGPVTDALDGKSMDVDWVRIWRQ